MSVLLCAAYAPVCSHSVFSWSMVNPQQERAVDPTRRQLKYCSNTQYSLPPEIILMKRTDRDVNNTDEKECPAINNTGEQFHNTR